MLVINIIKMLKTWFVWFNKCLYWRWRDCRNIRCNMSWIFLKHNNFLADTSFSACSFFKYLDQQVWYVQVLFLLQYFYSTPLLSSFAELAFQLAFELAVKVVSSARLSELESSSLVSNLSSKGFLFNLEDLSDTMIILLFNIIAWL